MEDNNVIQFLDTAKKNLERGAAPIVIDDIEKLIHELVGKMQKNKGNRIGILHTEQMPPGKTNDIHQIKQKINEICRFINDRYPL